jgi:hypothetical protein
MCFWKLTPETTPLEDPYTTLPPAESRHRSEPPTPISLSFSFRQPSEKAIEVELWSPPAMCHSMFLFVKQGISLFHVYTKFNGFTERIQQLNNCWQIFHGTKE